MRTQRGAISAAAIVFCAALAACSGAASDGGTVPSSGGGTGDGPGGGSSQAQGGSATGPAGMNEIGMPVVDGLMPELAAMPVPDGVGFTQGTSIGDSSGTVVQDAYTDQALDEAFAYYADALPAAGFQITSTEPGDAGGIIEFVDPDGHPGKVVVQPSALGPPTNIHIEVYLDRERVLTSAAPAALSSTSSGGGARATLEVAGSTYEVVDGGAGECDLHDQFVTVTIESDSALITAIAGPTGGFFQAQVTPTDFWTAGANGDSGTVVFTVDGGRATWSGPMTDLTTNQTADGTLTVEC